MAFFAGVMMNNLFHILKAKVKKMNAKVLKLRRRDLVVAILAAGLTFGAVSLSQPDETPLPSTVFDWTQIEVVPTEKGARRHFFETSTDMLEYLEMHVTTLKPHTTSHAPHRHVDEEFIIVKEGTVEEVINGKTYRAGPGSVIFLASNDEHGIRNVGDTEASYYAIRWRSRDQN